MPPSLSILKNNFYKRGEKNYILEILEHKASCSTWNRKQFFISDIEISEEY